ncbi:hypothetical protein, partial [Burkholderia territorii]|uniref:hypothetical protein n=1 Tax=Burkholderia territorii TaxID=1503055 RepID=UPI001BA84921
NVSHTVLGASIVDVIWGMKNHTPVFVWQSPASSVKAPQEYGNMHSSKISQRVQRVRIGH